MVHGLFDHRIVDNEKKYLQLYFYFRAKMPSDPLEAELLAMAGAAIGVDDNLLGIY